MATRQPFSADDYHGDPKRRAKSGLVRAASKALRPLGFDLELAHYYSPIPRAEDRPAQWWETPAELPGIDLDLDAQLDFIRTELASAVAEFKPPRSSAEPLTYHLDNGLYQGGDADLLYAMVRRFKPRRILEIGAGFSTLISAEAVTRNKAEGHDSELISCDPYALAPPPNAVPGLAELRPVAAENLGPAEFADLKANDILFIDSSHTVKVGGDVVHLFCQVLPQLAPGVIVHVHDIYLPWPYPRAWVAHMRWYWAEQYLLQALLCENPHWRVLSANHALYRQRGAALTELIPNLNGTEHAPLSFWFQRL
ncbi:MAG: class I SAM-dependent methyltransferase [Solirubrobacterales bacterium]|nr:class I SAM-dependent methyltransferase [Solirubrobacterales bacterium]